MDLQHTQTRLAVLGFNLTLLTFVTGTLANLAVHEPNGLWVYLESFAPIGLGFLFSLFGIAAFLRAQSNNHLGWFLAGQLLLYFAVSQFLASGMNNVIFAIEGGLKGHDGAVASLILFILVALGELLWLWLLFGAPILDIVKRRRDPAASKDSYAWLIYALLLTSAFLVDGSAYYLRRGHHGLFEFVWMVVAQFGQPFLWLT